MKTGLLFDCIQELFARGYALTSGNEPYPLRSLLREEIEKLAPGGTRTSYRRRIKLAGAFRD